jgi:hypothetical protein
MPHRAVVAVTTAGALALMSAPAVAQAPAPLVFREVQKGTTFSFVDNPPRSTNARRPRPSAGDALVFTIPLAKGGRSRGTLRATCTITGIVKKRTSALCYGVLSLKEGELVLVVSTSNLDDPKTTGSVIGGTRAYAGARGTFVSTTTKDGTIDTVTFAR